MSPVDRKWLPLLVSVIAATLTACARTETAPETRGISSSNNPQVIERGRYLVHGPAHCASCHGAPAAPGDNTAGEAPLSGGQTFDLGPLGRAVAPNITSDPRFGIGALSDQDLVRALRYGVSHRGRALIPLMSFGGMSDPDLRAVISYLRTLPAVPKPTPSHDLSILGTLGLRLLLEPKGPARPPPFHVEPERSARYGRYLAREVANCDGCHTRRSKWTGVFNGPAFAGGMQIEEGGTTFVTANLTPVPGGVMHALPEQAFIEKFRRRGAAAQASPMPWKAYARMTDSDLAAIYRFLRTLPPTDTPT